MVGLEGLPKGNKDASTRRGTDVSLVLMIVENVRFCNSKVKLRFRRFWWCRFAYHRLLPVILSGSWAISHVPGGVASLTTGYYLRSFQDRGQYPTFPVVSLRLPPATFCDPFRIMGIIPRFRWCRSAYHRLLSAIPSGSWAISRTDYRE